MLHRKLLEMLRILDKSDINRLRLFLQSPYHVADKWRTPMLQLLEEILQFNCDPEHPRLDKKLVSQLVFPDKPYSENKKGPIDDLSSELFTAIKKFITLQEFERGNYVFEEGLTLAKIYRNNRMQERYWQSINSLEKIQKSQEIKGELFYYQQFRLEEEKNMFLGLHNSFVDDANIGNTLKSLDYFYAVIKLELLTFSIYQNKLYNNDTNEAKEFKSWFAQLNDKYPRLQDEPLIQLYSLAIQLLENPFDDALYREMIDATRINKNKIPDPKYRDFQSLNRNVGVNKYMKFGGEKIIAEFFELYKEHYEEGLFFIENKILVNSFRMAVMLALKSKNFEWAYSIILKHPPENISGTKYPKEIWSLTLADYLFYTGKYEDSLELIEYKSFENPLFSLFADTLVIKVYYETKNDLLEFRIKSMEQKVRRTQLTKAIKANYYNFLKKLDKIVKYRFPKNEKKLSALREDIISLPSVLEREWLLEKTNLALNA